MIWIQKTLMDELQLWMLALMEFWYVSGGKEGQREGRQRSPIIAVEVEILDIKPMQSNKMVSWDNLSL